MIICQYVIFYMLSWDIFGMCNKDVWKAIGFTGLELWRNIFKHHQNVSRSEAIRIDHIRAGDLVQ